MTKNKQEIFGLLCDYSETGTEGTYWSVYIGDFTAKDWKYENQIIINLGDYLKILNKNNLQEIIWQGIVRYDKTHFSEWVGEDPTITKEDWYKYFTEGYFGIVIKQVEEPSIDKLREI